MCPAVLPGIQALALWLSSTQVSYSHLCVYVCVLGDKAKRQLCETMIFFLLHYSASRTPEHFSDSPMEPVA